MTALAPRLAKCEARRLLNQGSTLFTFILAALVMIFATFAWLLVTDGIIGFLDLLLPETDAALLLDSVYTACYLVGWFLLVMPLWYGLRAIGLQVTREGGAAVIGLFCAFSSFRSLTRVWRASLWIVWRFALAGGLVVGLWLGAGCLGASAHPLLAVLLYGAAAILTPLPLLLTVGTHRIYPLMLAEPELGVFRVVLTAMRLGYRGLGRTISFWLSFIPWFLLALATGGVMLVLYVLPYFILADTVRLDARPIFDQSKEINHV